MEREREDHQYVTLPATLRQLYHKDLYVEVMDQLFKDLHMCGLPTEELDFDNPQDFWEIFFDYIGNLVYTNRKMFWALTYRIDLDQDELQEIIDGNRPRAALLKLCSRVLYREIAKVRGRKAYEKNFGTSK